MYTAKQGRDRDAEHNTLMEVIGPATDAAWKPETEIFADKEHIARSAMQPGISGRVELLAVEPRG